MSLNAHNSVGEVQSSTASISSVNVRMSLRKWMLHEYCDAFSEGLIYLMVVFCPWALGTTDTWAIWTMNIMSWTLGLLLVAKLAIRCSTSYCFPRWGLYPDPGDGTPRPGRRLLLTQRWLAGLTVFLLLYCLTYALNPSSTFDTTTLTLVERPHIPWLPHSFDPASSWNAFFKYLGYACAFWGIYDWLMGKGANERNPVRTESEDEHRSSLSLPSRLQRLFWVMTINGGALAVEGIAQRLAGCNLLLFNWLPTHNVKVIEQFGPWAYRANASQYFNIMWPACLGFWWTLHRARHSGRGIWPVVARQLVLVSVCLMALCPLMSSSRLGSVIDLAAMVAAVGIVLRGMRRSGAGAKIGVFLVLGMVLLFGYLFAWSHIVERLETDDFEVSLMMRNAIYDRAEKMSDDYPILGTGPGTVEYLYVFYRLDPEEDWYAQIHNDYLETEISFGLLGMSVIAITFGLLNFRWFVPGGIGGGRRLPLFLWLAMGGCLIHARWDFPFQVYSVVLAFATVAAIQFTLSRHASR